MDEVDKQADRVYRSGRRSGVMLDVKDYGQIMERLHTMETMLIELNSKFNDCFNGFTPDGGPCGHKRKFDDDDFLIGDSFKRVKRKCRRSIPVISDSDDG